MWSTSRKVEKRLCLHPHSDLSISANITVKVLIGPNCCVSCYVDTQLKEWLRPLSQFMQVTEQQSDGNFCSVLSSLRYEPPPKMQKASHTTANFHATIKLWLIYSLTIYITKVGTSEKWFARQPSITLLFTQ